MRQVCIVASMLVVAGCTVKQPPHTQPPVLPLAEAKAVSDPEPQPLAPPSLSDFLDELPPDVEAAVDKFAKTGKAAIIKPKDMDFVIFPYGLSQPEVRCKPFSVCDIELEPGEEVLDLAAADTVRWQFQPLREGPKDRRVTHIVVKPQDELNKMETGLVVGTDRRVYRIKLKSSPTMHVVNAKFYYPEDMVRRFNEAQDADREDQAPVIAELPTVSVEHLDYDYLIEGQTPFTPTMAMNDGKRTYLKMPHGIATQGGPALFVEQNGKSELVNYTPRQDYFVVHGVPDRMVLRSGVGRDSRDVTVSRGR